ncbi:MAG: hypothetical protein R3C61_26115 [Bacteroidia bacterium]
MKTSDKKNTENASPLPVLYGRLKEMNSDTGVLRFVSSARHQTNRYTTGLFYKPLSRFISQYGNAGPTTE